MGAVFDKQTRKLTVKLPVVKEAALPLSTGPSLVEPHTLWGVKDELAILTPVVEVLTPELKPPPAVPETLVDLPCITAHQNDEVVTVMVAAVGACAVDATIHEHYFGPVLTHSYGLTFTVVDLTGQRDPMQLCLTIKLDAAIAPDASSFE